MKVLMTGGTGFLGSALRKRLESDGHTITCLSRYKTGTEGNTRFVPLGDLPRVDHQDAVVNLAGETVVGLWTPSKRKAIYHSRVDITRELSDWIDKSSHRPDVFLCGSAVGIYGDAGAEPLTEQTDASQAEGFLAKVCRDWEEAASPAAWKGTRSVLLRTGQVLDPAGGYLKQVLPKFKRLPILVIGNNDAYFPWVALDDWIEMVMFALTNEQISGPLNLVSPNPVTQRALTEALAKKLRKRVWGRVPRWVLKLVAGELGESITASQRVFPEKTLKAGYQFRHPELAGYLESLPG
jgi:uncharacterized protein